MSDYWTKTKNLFSSLIQKPMMTDKLLKKPPPNYIYDIVIESMKKTNFPKGLLTEQEEDRKFFMDDTHNKLIILQKLIDFTEFAQKEKLDINSLSIVKGDYPEKTNYFLQLFYKTVTENDNNKKVKYINEFLKIENMKIYNLQKELNEQKNINKNLEEELKKYKDIVKDYESNKNLKANDKSEKNDDSKESLYAKIIEKDDKIEELKQKLSRYQIMLDEGEKLISLIFVSVDQKIHCSIICKNNDKFNKVENELYEIYPEYSEFENYFTFNGKKINKNKTLTENGIKNNDIIILNKFEE